MVKVNFYHHNLIPHL